MRVGWKGGMATYLPSPRKEFAELVFAVLSTNIDFENDSTTPILLVTTATDKDSTPVSLYHEDKYATTPSTHAYILEGRTPDLR